MARRFLRRVEVSFFHADLGVIYRFAPDDDAEALYLSFDVLHEVANPMAQGEMKIWNLSASTRSLFDTPGVEVAIHAGYAGRKLSTLFRGTARRIFTEHKTPDVETTIILGAPRKFSNNVVFELEEPEPLINLVVGVLRAMDVGWDPFNLLKTIGGGSDLSDRDLKLIFSRTYTDSFLHDRNAEVFRRSQGKRTEENYSYGPGPASQMLFELLDAAGFYWAYRPNDSVSVLPQDAVSSDYDSYVLIREASGMVGSPAVAVDDDGRKSLHVRSLLDTRVLLDKGLVVESTRMDDGAVWRPTSVRHAGDNRAGSFETVIEARRL